MFVKTPPTTLLGLPQEILIQILGELDCRSLVLSRVVCRHFNNIVDTHNGLQYVIELFSAGVNNGPPSPMLSTKDRSGRLKTYQQMWSTFDNVKEYDIPNSSHHAYELAGGVFGQKIDSEDTRLTFHKLPATTRNSPNSHHWTLKDFGHHVTDFTMDPCQDLLVTMHIPLATAEMSDNVVELYLLSLTTGKKHPGASKKYLQHTFEGGSGDLGGLLHWNHTLQLCENFLCIHHIYEMEATELDNLTIWDWKSGDMLMTLENCFIASFAFVTNNLIMFSMNRATPTDRCEGDDECRLVVCDIVQTSMLQVERPGCFVDICELHFPAIVPYADIYSIEIRSDPYPSAFIDGNVLNTQSLSSSSTHCNDVPFSVAPMSRVFVITIGAQAAAVRRRGGRLVSFMFFIPLSTITEQIRSKSTFQPHVIEDLSMERDLFEILPAPGPRRDIAAVWLQWGPNGSRAFLYMTTDLNMDYVCNMYGSRYARTYPPGRRMVTRVQLLDFNQLSVRRKHNEEQSHSGTVDADRSGKAKGGLPTVARSQTKTVFEPTTITTKSGDVFDQDIKTTLPYRETILDLNIEIRSLMMTEDTLILEREGQRNFRILSI